jgi:hypothetical protein
MTCSRRPLAGPHPRKSAPACIGCGMPSAYVDNDALWSIVMALEHYDSFFRAYPEKLAEKTAQ